MFSFWVTEEFEIMFVLLFFFSLNLDHRPSRILASLLPLPLLKHVEILKHVPASRGEGEV